MSGMYFTPLKRVFLNLSGGTVTGNTLFTQSVSAATLYSGSTNLYDIFAGIGQGGGNTYLDPTQVAFGNSSSGLTGDSQFTYSNSVLTINGGGYTAQLGLTNGFSLTVPQGFTFFSPSGYLNHSAVAHNFYSGNVGIGTVFNYTPSHTLEVAGSVLVTGLTRTSSLSASSITASTMYVVNPISTYNFSIGSWVFGIDSTSVALNRADLGAINGFAWYYGGPAYPQKFGFNYANFGSASLAPSNVSAYLNIAGSVSGRSSLAIESGTTVASPFDGDIWNDGSHLYGRLGGQIRQLDFDGTLSATSLTANTLVFPNIPTGRILSTDSNSAVTGSNLYFTNGPTNYIVDIATYMQIGYQNGYQFINSAGGWPFRITQAYNSFELNESGVTLNDTGYLNTGYTRINSLATSGDGIVYATSLGKLSKQLLPTSYIAFGSSTSGLSGNSFFKIFPNDAVGGGYAQIGYLNLGYGVAQGGYFGMDISAFGTTRISNSLSYIEFDRISGSAGNLKFNVSREIFRTTYSGVSFFHTAEATAYVDIQSASTATASLRIRSGVTVTIPNEGDIWNDGSHFYGRLQNQNRELDSYLSSTQVAFGSSTNGISGNTSLTFSLQPSISRLTVGDSSHVGQIDFTSSSSNYLRIEAGLDSYITQFVSGNIFVRNWAGTHSLVFQEDATVRAISFSATSLTATTIKANSITATTVSAATIQSDTLRGTTERMVQADTGGTMYAVQDIVSGIVTDPTAITLLTTFSNWNSSGVYTGTTITNTYQGQFYGDTGNTYVFLALADNYFARIPRV